ncbi:MAG: tetratricopeptide repeat protein [Deltaproteobacteria bacterium]|nr:tetratricopeptide repeat protein [Deltaproteobacteria bacterium]
MKFRPWGSPLLLVATVSLAYLNAFRGVFQFDDYNVIVDNPAVHSFAAWFSDAPRGIRPFLKFTYTLNRTCGLGLFGFHLFNVGVHAANTVLVYSLSRRFAGQDGDPRPGRFAGTAPLVAALLFALHPVQTEAVTYVSGRSMSLMAFFYLGSLLAYDHGARTSRRLWLQLVSPGLFLLAILTKEVAVTLPPALALWEMSRREGMEPWTVIARRQAPHWILLACAMATIAVHPGYRDLLVFGFGARGLWDNLLSQVNGVAYLLSRLVWVHRLNIDPDLPALTVWTPLLAVQAVLLLSLLVLGMSALRNAPRLGFGLLWFFLHLLPTNSVVPRLDIANERHLYLAVWGIFLAVGAGAEKLRSAKSSAWRWVRIGMISGMIVLGCFTLMRNDVYRSEAALWEDTAKYSPGKPRVHNNLGYAYQLAGYPEKAVLSYREALRLRPDFRPAQGNLAALLAGFKERFSRETRP